MNISVTENSPTVLRQRIREEQAIQLIDAREYPEFAAGHIEGSLLIPMAEIADQAPSLDRNRPIVLICRSGKRSAQAQETLRAAGFSNVAHLAGGLTAWEQAGLPLKTIQGAPWSLERQVRVAAGSLVLLGVILGTWAAPAFYGLSAFVGAGLIFAGVTDWCGMGLLIARLPWNRRQNAACNSSCHLTSATNESRTAAR